jgi:hypothetical protein
MLKGCQTLRLISCTPANNHSLAFRWSVTTGYSLCSPTGCANRSPKENQPGESKYVCPFEGRGRAIALFYLSISCCPEYRFFIAELLKLVRSVAH